MQNAVQLGDSNSADLRESALDRQIEAMDTHSAADTAAARDADLLRCISEVSGGNYLIRPTGSDPVSLAFGKLIDQLSRAAGEELGQVVKLSIQTNETSIFSLNMLSNMRKVDERAQGVAAAAEQMAATVQEIGQYGQNISEQTQQAGTLTELGSAATKDAVEGMDRIAGAVERSVEKVNILREFSDSINSISGDIKKIANHTNLLAINAAIEAARAGEAGKGFAIVAEEVKNLSGQTRAATEEVNDIVGKLQAETTDILESMVQSSKAVSSGQEAINAVGTRMAEIQSAILEVNQNTTQISDALSEQRKASQDVAEGIIRIADHSTTNVSDTESVITAMGEVQKITNGRISVLSQIEVPNKVIKLAQSDHVIWKQRLANMISGREGLSADELADHHTCRLGKWYDKVDSPEILNHPLFKQLAEPHKTVHEHGIMAVRLFNNRDLPGALERIALVETASVEVLRILSELDSLTSS